MCELHLQFALPRLRVLQCGFCSGVCVLDGLITRVLVLFHRGIVQGLCCYLVFSDLVKVSDLSDCAAVALAMVRLGGSVTFVVPPRRVFELNEAVDL